MKPTVNTWLLACACLATGVAGGLWLSQQKSSAWPEGLPLPPLEAHATASAAHDNFVIATGWFDDETEGLFFLDFLTGDLKATVINRRGVGFNAAYQYNIANDFPSGAVKNPKYLMVTGAARDLQGVGGNRFARCVLYVVEATSGQVVAYGLPFNRSRQTAGKPQAGTFIPLAKASLRNEFVRDQ